MSLLSLIHKTGTVSLSDSVEGFLTPVKVTESVIVVILMRCLPCHKEIMKTYTMKKIVPVTHAVTAKEPNNHANLFSTLTATRAKLRAELSAFWNWEKAMTTDFIRLGAYENVMRKREFGKQV